MTLLSAPTQRFSVQKRAEFCFTGFLGSYTAQQYCLPERNVAINFSNLIVRERRKASSYQQYPVAWISSEDRSTKFLIGVSLWYIFLRLHYPSLKYRHMYFTPRSSDSTFCNPINCRALTIICTLAFQHSSCN